MNFLNFMQIWLKWMDNTDHRTLRADKMTLSPYIIICLSLISLYPFPSLGQPLQALNSQVIHPLSLGSVHYLPYLITHISPNTKILLLCLWISQLITKKNPRSSLNFPYIVNEPWISLKITAPHISRPSIQRWAEILLVPHCYF